MQQLTDLPIRTLTVHWFHEFDAFLQDGYRKISGHQLSESSMRLALQHVRVFSLWHERTFKAAFEPINLTNYDLHLYRKFSLGQAKVKATTWNSRFWALTIFSTWIEGVYGLVNLMEGVEQKEQGLVSTKHRSLADNEYHRLVHVLEQDPQRSVTIFEHQVAVRTWAAVSLMLHAGLRVAEVSQVEPGDITISQRSGSVLVRKGKGDKQREVPLNLNARRALAAWIQIRPDTSTLFDLTARSHQRDVVDLGSRIGIPDLTPHWLRYTFAKRLEAIGTAIEKISSLLGHTSIEVTRRYLRSSMEELQAAVEGVI
jgi:integrase/recombinase XerD